MPVLKYYNQGTSAWEDLSTAGPPGPSGPLGPTGPTGPAGTGPTALNDLTDVDTVTTPPADGDSLTYDAASGQWVPGPGGASLVEEVMVADVEPTDPAVELWVNTTTTTTTGNARSGWEIFDSRYASRTAEIALDVDAIAVSGYWLIDANTTGTVPPGDPQQIIHALVLDPDIQIQYAYNPHSDGVEGVAQVHNRNKYGGVWSQWQNVTPKVIV